MASQINRKTRKIHTNCFFAFFIIFITSFSFLKAQVIDVAVNVNPDNNYIVDYGETKKIESITFTESTGFDQFGGAGDRRIRITAPTDFKFGGGEGSVGVASNDDIPSAPTITIDQSGNYLDIEFTVRELDPDLDPGPDAYSVTDVITVSNLVLEPDSTNTDVYDAPLVFQNAGAGGFSLNYTPINFVMDNPQLNLQNDSISYSTAQQCSSNPITFDFRINGVTDTNLSDIVQIWYMLDDGVAVAPRPHQIFSGEYDDDEILFTTSEIRFEDVSMEVQLNFENGWKYSKTYTIGDIDDGTEQDIELTETDLVDFAVESGFYSMFNTSDSLAGLINDYYSVNENNNTRKNSWYYEVIGETTSNTVITYDTYGSGTVANPYYKNHMINPNKAGAGPLELFFVRSSSQSGNECVDTASITVNITPKVLTSEEVFCYGVDDSATVQVAYNALKRHDGKAPDYKLTEYDRLEITYEGKTKIFKTKNDEGGFYNYKYSISEIYEDIGPDDDDVDIFFEVYANVTTYAYMDTVDKWTCMPYYYFDDFIWPVYQARGSTCEIDYMNHNTCTYGWEYNYKCTTTKLVETNTSNISLQTGDAKILKPSGNGYLTDFNAVYCPSNIPIRLNTNYTIANVTSSMGGVVYDDNGGLFDSWDYVPYNAWLNDTVLATDSVFVADTLFGIDTSYVSSGDTLVIDTLTLYYIDDNGCTSDTVYTIDIRTDTLVNTGGVLEDFSLMHCPVDKDIPLESTFPVGDTIIGKGITYHVADGSFTFNPIQLYDTTPDLVKYVVTDSIFLTYNDERGCPYTSRFIVTVTPKPDLDISVLNLCIGDTVGFNPNLVLNDTSKVEQWLWDFGDEFSIYNPGYLDMDSTVNTHGGRTIGYYSLPSHIYEAAGNYTSTVEVHLTNGCSAQDTFDFVIDNYAVMSLDYQNKLIGNPTPFTLSIQDVDSSRVAVLNWDFDDAAIDSSGIYTTPYINSKVVGYETPGVHAVTLRATTLNNCSSDTVIYVPSFEVIEVTPESLYSEGFSGGQPTSWISSKEYNVGQASSWKYVPVSGTFADDKHISGNMWLVGDYRDSVDNEKGWLESPCFDISGLDFPLLTLDIYQSIDKGIDGAVMQYTTNDGESWQTLGTDETGVEWFNTAGIKKEPGKDDNAINEGSLGWSLNNSQWATARHPLEEVRDNNGAGCVRFRIAYNSNDIHSNEFNGFGVDNLLISQRDRIVLLEEFVNSEMPVATPREVDIDEFMETHQVEVCDMRYHMRSGHYSDVLSMKVNWQDVSSRASEYGILYSGPASVMDGIASGASLKYDVEFAKRTLSDPTFRISDVEITKDGGQMNISASVKLINDYMQEFYGEHHNLVRIAIVQKEMADDDGNTYDNVVVELLPSGVDNVVEYIEPDFAVGETLEINASWTPNVRTIDNEYRVVIYVQSEWGYDEVQQVYFEDVDPSVVPEVHSGISSTSFANGYSIYPNPVYNELFIALNNDVAGDVNWSIYTASGKSVKQGTILNGDNVISVPVADLASGLYVVELIQKDGNRITTKISKN